MSERMLGESSGTRALGDWWVITGPGYTGGRGPHRGKEAAQRSITWWKYKSGKDESVIEWHGPFETNVLGRKFLASLPTQKG